jgi:hypothetical protein
LRLCHAVVEVVDARAGAIALGFGTSERTLLCATADDATRFEDAQDLVREGPSLDAFRTGTAVIATTPTDLERRWPALSETLPGSTSGVVHALPMQPGDTVIGVMTIHHAPPATDLTALMPELQFLADAVGAAIIGDLPTQADPSRLWTERDRVSQATGMIVAQLDLDAVDALAVLRAHAFAEAASVVEISRRVVARELDFGRPDPTESP